MTHGRLLLLILFATLSLAIIACETTEPASRKAGVAERMILGPGGLLADLPLIEDATVEATSSYDRTGGNNDGFDGTYSFLRQEPNGEYVIYEGLGPGAIVRMWFTAPDPAKQIKFYFDGETAPRIDLPIREIFSGNTFPFVKPLVGDDTVSSGGFICYLALPFNKSIKVTTADRARFYSISGIRYQDGRKIETYSPEWSGADRQRLEAICAKLNNLGNDPKDIRNEKIETTNGKVDSGKEAVLLDIKGQGTITKIHFKMDSPDEHAWRKVLIRAWWDGSEAPAIDAPVGDFFGTGFSPVEFRSLAVGMTADGAYCYFPMPYRQSARIALINGSKQSIEYEAEMAYSKGRVPKNFGAFHAKWHSVVTVAGIPYGILHATGRGKFVGDNITMQGPGGYAFLEGDEKIRVDGEEKPSTHGTGTEDYFMGGWYFNHGTFNCPYNGLSVRDEGNSRISAWRHHIPDAIPFKQNIQADIEHGPGDDQPNTDYCGVAYWYVLGEGTDFFKPLNPAELRYPGKRIASPDGMIEAEKIKTVRTSGPKAGTRTWESISEAFTGGAQSHLPAKIGDWVEYETKNEYADQAKVRIHLTHGPEYGIVQILMEGKPLGEPIDCYNSSFQPSIEHKLPGVTVPDSAYVLRFESKGKNEKATGAEIGVDGWRFISDSPYITEAMVIGPFKSPGKDKALDKVYPPEQEIKLDATYPGNHGDVKWRLMKAGNNNQFNFKEFLGTDNDLIAYAWIRVKSDRARKVLALLGSDDAVRVWVNGQVAFNHLISRGVAPDDDRFPVEFQAGWNDVLIKVEQGQGDWGLMFRFTDPGGVLEYAVTK